MAAAIDEEAGEKVKPVTKSAMHVNYDDLDGLLTTMGVVAALVISFIIGLNCTVTQEEFVHYDFNQNMRDPSFRKFAVGVLDGQLTECVQYCTDASAAAICTANCKQKHTIDWEFTDPDTNKVFNLKSAMLRSDMLDDSSVVPEIEAATQLLVHEFPMEKMQIWSTLTGKEVKSLQLLSFTWWSTVFVGLPLFASIVLYIVLQLSDARQSEGGLYAFYLPPVIVLLYILMALGILIDIASIAEVFYARHPSPRSASRTNDAPMIFAVLIVVAIMVYVLALVVRVMVQKCKEKRAAAAAAAQSS
jgi:hypothetical protein